MSDSDRDTTCAADRLVEKTFLPVLGYQEAAEQKLNLVAGWTVQYKLISRT